MKIVHLLQSNKFSGAENVVCQIIKQFDDLDEYEMIYVSTDGPIKFELEKRKISYYMLSSFSQSEIRYMIHSLKPDIVHAHDFNASVRAARIPNITVISHIHSNPLWLKNICINSIVYAIASIRIKKIIGVSKIIYDEYIFKKLIKKKFMLVENVVDEAYIKEKAREPLESKIDLLYIGRLSKAKNPLEFLHIIKELNESGESVNAQMLGVGSLEIECLEFIQKNKLSENVRMIGFDSNPYKYMARAKIIVIPSIYEGFGLVAVEAMILGRVVVASNVGGLKDIVDNKSGRLCNSHREFIEAIKIILGNEKLRAEMEHEAQYRAIKYSDLETFKDRLKKAYCEFIE